MGMLSLIFLNIVWNHSEEIEYEEAETYDDSFWEGYKFAIDTVREWLPEEDCYDEIITGYFSTGNTANAYDTGYKNGFNDGLRKAGENPLIFETGYWEGYDDGYCEGYAEAYKLVP